MGGEGATVRGRIHEYRHTVRYLECDQQGVVFNMWYLGYFDEALAAFLAGGGISYRELIDTGFDVQLVHSDIDWMAPLRWGDEVVVAVRLLRAGHTSFTLGFEVAVAVPATAPGPTAPTAPPAALPARRLVAAGRTVYVAIRTDGSGKVPIPSMLAAAIGAPA